MTSESTSQRASPGEYASALLYFGPICLPTAFGCAYLYHLQAGGMPVLWLIPVVVALVVWVGVSIEVAEF